MCACMKPLIGLIPFFVDQFSFLGIFAVIIDFCTNIFLFFFFWFLVYVCVQNSEIAFNWSVSCSILYTACTHWVKYMLLWMAELISTLTFVVVVFFSFFSFQLGIINVRQFLVLNWLKFRANDTVSLIFAATPITNGEQRKNNEKKTN